MAVPREKTGQRRPRATAPTTQATPPAAPARNGDAPDAPKPEFRSVLLVADESPRRPLRRRLHVAAVLAAVVYGGAAYAAYTFVSPHLRAGGPSPVAGPAKQVGPAPALSATSRETLAMRALAARAQRGVYLVEGAGGSIGSGFVAWVQPGKNRSFVLTARAVVAGLLAEGGRTVYVRRGGRFWTGRLVRADQASGLALVRVPTVLERPLWQARGDQRPLADGAPAYLVPAGPDTPFGEGALAGRPNGRFGLRTGAAALNLGAPVLADGGRIGGVVVATNPNGVNTVVPIDSACGEIRRCR